MQGTPQSSLPSRLSGSLERVDLAWHECVSSKANFESRQALLDAMLHDSASHENSTVIVASLEVT